MGKYKSDKEKHQIKVIKYFEISALTVLIIAFGVLIYCIYVSINDGNITWGNKSYGAEKLSTNTEINNTISQNTEDISDMIEKINSSIVGISKIKDKGNTIFLKDGTTSLNLGTGFVVTDDGYIITNEHVSGDKYSVCYVTLENGKTYNADVIWADTDVDLSIIKININKLSYLELGDSDSLKVAQNVYAIGNPVGFEFQRTVTSGIVSGLDRTIKIQDTDKTYYMEDLIQTDATINPGNSGGPLINKYGQVIGINSVKITTAEGIGFASPVNLIKPILESIKNNKEYKATTLGVFAYDKNVIPYINQDLGINQTLDNGIYVAEVVKNSPAENAGIKEGDILTKIDSQILNKMSDLRKYIYTKQPGDNVKIKYIRNGKEAELAVTLVKKNN